MLCALVLCSGKLSIVPTRYTIPTDDIPIVSICGISDGRIFMGGYDGSLYEFDYQSLVSGSQPPKTIEQRLQDYYDGTATSIQLKDSSPAFQAMRKGKRAFVSLLGGSECPQKCRKLNHSAKGFRRLLQWSYQIGCEKPRRLYLVQQARDLWKRLFTMRSANACIRLLLAVSYQFMTCEGRTSLSTLRLTGRALRVNTYRLLQRSICLRLHLQSTLLVAVHLLRQVLGAWTVPDPSSSWPPMSVPAY